MSKTAVLLFILFILASIYLVPPTPEFPQPPTGSLQSTEPADTESIYRRSYFTNLSRQEIMDYYQKQFYFPGQFKLNYPPEEAFTLIRDQTRSSFLEEIVHPGRESIYVNGFFPTKPTEQININGVNYLNKVTVRMVPSHSVTRLTILLATILCSYFLLRQFHES